MDLGLFFMPLHRPTKPWAQALDEDRRMIIAADELGYAEAWMGEHFTTKAEQVPAPLIFLATLFNEAPHMRFGTGVVNLGHRHPVVVAAEAALFDQLSGGRLMLGVGPGGLASDAELFGRPDAGERLEVALESIDHIIRLWTEQPPLALDGKYWQGSLEREIWPSHGVGQFPRPLQQPHPPMAMAMSSPAGRTVDVVAERSFIPMSANFVPLSSLRTQWETYSQRRDELALPVDRSIWRVCRSVLITDSDAEAEEILADPDGVFSHYYRYLGGVRDVERLTREGEPPLVEMNERYNVAKAVSRNVIAGSVATVTAKLIDMVDFLGPFGTLVKVGHDWDDTDRWLRSLKRLAIDVGPRVAQHMDSLPAA